MKIKKRLFTCKTTKLDDSYWDNPLGNMKTWLKLKDRLELFLVDDRHYCGMTKEKKRYKQRSISKRSLYVMFRKNFVLNLDFFRGKQKRTMILCMRLIELPEGIHIMKHRKDQKRFYA